VGSPATSYDLLIDTVNLFLSPAMYFSADSDVQGSSNTWVGAGKNYVVTSTSTQTTDSVVSMLDVENAVE
jgi:cathepsin E